MKVPNKPHIFLSKRIRHKDTGKRFWLVDCGSDCIIDRVAAAYAFVEQRNQQEQRI